VSFLDELLTSTRARVAAARSETSLEEMSRRAENAPAPRGFIAALDRDEVALIAEIKRATPSEGVLAPDLDAATAARAYAEGGAAALSVLTEPHLFKGSLEDVTAARTCGLPVLRKDFVLDPFQVFEGRAAGADAILLIVRTLGDELRPLIELVHDLGMDALVEVFNGLELERAVQAGARAIGVNHRDLETFEVDPERTARLAPAVPEGVTLVALSGVSTRAEVVSLGRAGAAAVLVGTALVRASDPASKVRALRGLD
jgi:indole-3-glycerol phosphate synthase